MNRLLVGVIVSIGVIMASTSMSFADGVIIPGSIKIEEFKKVMKENGMDLYGDDESDGFIENEGNKIKVVTYKSVTMEQLEMMKETAFKTVRKNG